MIDPKLIAAGLLVSLITVPACTRGSAGPQAAAISPRMRQFSRETTYKRQLQKQLRAIRYINRNAATAISPMQAQELLGILKPWATRDRMTDEEAQRMTLKIDKVMTAPQRTAMASFKPRWEDFGGTFARPKGAAGPGGRPGPGTNRIRQMQDANWLSTKGQPDGPLPPGRARANLQRLAWLQARARNGGAPGHRPALPRRSAA